MPLRDVKHAGSRLDAQKARLVFAPKGPQPVSPGQSAAAKPPWVPRHTALSKQYQTAKPDSKTRQAPFAGSMGNLGDQPQSFKPQTGTLQSFKPQTGTLSQQSRASRKTETHRTQASALGGLPDAARLDSQARSGDQAWGRGRGRRFRSRRQRDLSRAPSPTAVHATNSTPP